MPTESRKRSLSEISRTTSLAIARSVSVSQLLDPPQRSPGRERRVLVDVQAADADREALGPQARPAAGRAWLERHQVLDPLAGALGVCVLVAALKADEDPLEANRVDPLAAESVAIGDRVAV